MRELLPESVEAGLLHPAKLALLQQFQDWDRLCSTVEVIGEGYGACQGKLAVAQFHVSQCVAKFNFKQCVSLVFYPNREWPEPELAPVVTAGPGLVTAHDDLVSPNVHVTRHRECRGEISVDLGEDAVRSSSGGMGMEMLRL